MPAAYLFVTAPSASSLASSALSPAPAATAPRRLAFAYCPDLLIRTWQENRTENLSLSRLLRFQSVCTSVFLHLLRLRLFMWTCFIQIDHHMRASHQGSGFSCGGSNHRIDDGYAAASDYYGFCRQRSDGIIGQKVDAQLN